MQELTLLAPGLLRPPAPACVPPATARLLARARCDRSVPGEAAPWLALARGDAGTDALPAAAVARVGDGAPRDEAWWFHAEAVHLRADRDTVRLYAGPELAPDAGESAALAAAVNEVCAAEGMSLEISPAGRWYLRSAAEWQLDARTPAQLDGRSLTALMPRGRDAAAAQRLLTELQMLLHDHPVNRARGAAGRVALNGVWIWGGGKLESSRSLAAARIPPAWGDDPWLRGLCRLAGQRWAPLPASAEECLVADTPAALVLLPAGCDATALEREWYAPLLRAVRDGRLAALSLLSGEHRLSVDRRALRRWWRRRPLPSLWHAVGDSVDQP